MSNFISNIISTCIVGCVFAVNARVQIVPDQILEDCAPEGQHAGIFNFSEFELIPENDTHTFVNGKWKFDKPLNIPWPGALITERYERGQWLVQAFNRNYTDICPTLHTPTEPVYEIFKHVAGCPMPAGSAWDFDMVPITFPDFLLNTIPSHYTGRWRATFYSEFEDEDGKVLMECKRAYADIYEE